MTLPIPHRKAMEQLRQELLPISFIELSNNALILGGNPTCTTLDHNKISQLIIALTIINNELHERQLP